MRTRRRHAALAAAAVVAAAALSCGAGPAGADSTSSMFIGVKVGAGASSFAGGATGGANPRRAAAAGASLAIRFDASWAFEVDVLYDTKGADETGSVQIGDQTYSGPLSWKYTYTDIQAAVVRYVRLGPGSLRLLAGPVIAVLVTAELEHAQGTLDVETFTTASQMELALAVGYAYPLGRVHVGVDVRYALGLNTLDDVPLRDTYERKQQSWMGLFGVAVDLGR